MVWNDKGAVSQSFRGPLAGPSRPSAALPIRKQRRSPVFSIAAYYSFLATAPAPAPAPPPPMIGALSPSPDPSRYRPKPLAPRRFSKPEQKTRDERNVDASPRSAACIA